MSRVLRLRTNAKTNLLLRVLGRRPDGYHEIETIFHTLSLADTISIEPTTSDEIEVDMHAESSTSGGLPIASDNLVSVAARKLIEADGRTRGARIEIVKRIPIGAGLGGGSGNAAGALGGLNEVWGLGLDSGTLARLALEIGADVPYCLSGGTALATGLGERTTPLTAPETLWFALGISNEPLLTRAVYGEFEAHRDAADVGSGPMRLALGQGDVVAVAALVHNDLEPPAFRLRPGLAQLKSAMLEAGALGVVMSGSGPTMVGLARDHDHATSIAEAAERSFDRVVVSSSRPVCVERLD
jgi:4-diphosphocytidyl-2-C-methyl-D-erythritol kinase